MIHDEMHAGGDFRSSNEIESDIRRTRSRMDATLDELGNRLNARYLVNTALDWWEERSADARARGMAGTKVAYRTAVHQIKENPMPSLLIGAGIAWLMLQGGEEEEVEIRRRRPYRSGLREVPEGMAGQGYAGESMEGMEGVESEGPGFTDKMKEKAMHAKDAVMGAAGSVKEKAGEWSDTVQDKASEWSDAVQDTASGASQSARQMYRRSRFATERMGRDLRDSYQSGLHQVRESMDEYPLAAGIGFAALGALMGLLLPRTRREDELLGERSDELVDSIKEKGKDALERGKAVAERAAQTALDEANKQGLTVESAGEKLTEIASKAGEVLKKAKEEALQAADEQKLTPDQLKEQASSSSLGSSQPSQSQSSQSSVTAPIIQPSQPLTSSGSDCGCGGGTPAL